MTSDGPAVLLFVAPEARIETLWAELCRRAGQNLEQDVGVVSVRSAVLSGTDKRLMLVSWLHLLDSMATRAAGELDVQADIQQLRGLAQRMDAQAFLPLHAEELSSNIGRRALNFYRLFVSASDRARDEGWLDWIGRMSSDTDKTGRPVGVSGIRAWIGIHYPLWAQGESDDTPLWLQLETSPDLLNKISTQLRLRVAWTNHFPIHLKTGVEWDDVLADMVSQLQAIAEVIKAANSESP